MPVKNQSFRVKYPWIKEETEISLNLIRNFQTKTQIYLFTLTMSSEKPPLTISGSAKAETSLRPFETSTKSRSRTKSSDGSSTENVNKYTNQTWFNEHLRIATTSLQRPPFWGPILNFYNIKTTSEKRSPVNNGQKFGVSRVIVINRFGNIFLFSSEIFCGWKKGEAWENISVQPSNQYLR